MAAWVVVALIVLPVSVQLHGQTAKPWNIPSRYHNRKSPIGKDRASKLAGLRVYRKNCASCHGRRGKGDGPAASGLTVHPQNLRDMGRMAKFTDGDLFYMIRKGRKPMPAFRKTLKKNEVWQVIGFIRTFTPKLKPNAAAAATGTMWFSGPLPKVDTQIRTSLSKAVEQIETNHVALHAARKSGKRESIVAAISNLDSSVTMVKQLDMPATLKPEIDKFTKLIQSLLNDSADRIADQKALSAAQKSAHATLVRHLSAARKRYSTAATSTAGKKGT